MTEQSQIVGFSRKQLMRETGCSPATFGYYRDLGILPLLKESAGIGYSNLYAPRAVDVIRARLARRGRVQTSDEPTPIKPAE